MSFSLTLPQWYDLHVHVRQGPSMSAYIKAQLDMGCAGILAMPNTKPPVSKVFESDAADGWSIETYQSLIAQAGGDAFSAVIVPLYLTRQTTPAMIAAGALKGVLKACKYYPPHGTTGAEHGVPLDTLIENGVLKAMEDNNVILCVHGEEHDLPGEKYFDRDCNAEDIFYKERLPHVIDKFPNLKIVCEHITTKTAADFVRKAPATVAATITPQHLLYTVGDLIKGLRYHLFCLPVIKFAKDREALRKAATNPKKKFFAGTDSAPHTRKSTPCGCAAGCFTGGIAPQLYAHAFEQTGVSLEYPRGQRALKRFLCENGPHFYGLPVSRKKFTLLKEPEATELLQTPEGPVTPLSVGMGEPTLTWKIAR